MNDRDGIDLNDYDRRRFQKRRRIAPRTYLFASLLFATAAVIAYIMGH